MKHMLCRKRVQNYAKWKAIFEADFQAQHDSGLKLQNMWRDTQDPNNVFFIFEITDLAKAQAFVASPESAETGRRAGVIDGEIFYVEDD